MRVPHLTAASVGPAKAKRGHHINFCPYMLARLVSRMRLM